MKSGINPSIYLSLPQLCKDRRFASWGRQTAGFRRYVHAVLKADPLHMLLHVVHDGAQDLIARFIQQLHSHLVAQVQQRPQILQKRPPLRLQRDPGF